MKRETVRPRTFGSWLDWQLARRDWNKSDLASRLGVAPGDVSRWVRDVRMPSPPMVGKIADAFDMQKNDVLAIAGIADPDPEVDPQSNLAEILGLVMAVDWESDEDRMDHFVPLLRKWASADRARRE